MSNHNQQPIRQIGQPQPHPYPAQNVAHGFKPSLNFLKRKPPRQINVKARILVPFSASWCLFVVVDDGFKPSLESPKYLHHPFSAASTDNNRLFARQVK